MPVLLDQRHFAEELYKADVLSFLDNFPLLRNSVMRIELWKNADIKNMLANKGRAPGPHLFYRNRTTHNTQPLEEWSFTFDLSRSILAEHLSDSADVLDELAESFPGLLIRRYLSLDDRGHDTLHIQQPKRPFCQAWETMLAALSWSLPRHGMPFQLDGDVDAFWGNYKPEHYNTDVPLAFPSMVAFLPNLPAKIRAEVMTPHPLKSPWLAVDSVRNHSDVPGANGRSIAVSVCVCCKAPFQELLPAPGETVCCRPCLRRIFDDCHFCWEQIHKAESIELSCDHKTCTDCLVHCFRSGTADLHSFPPRCCEVQLFPHKYINLLTSDTVKRYIELSRQQDLRRNVTCATPSCGRYSIPYLQIQDQWALCENCVQLTCSQCGNNQEEHMRTASEATKCPVKDDELHAYAKEMGWKQCPSCRHMVSRSEGCNHMTCSCEQEFCYKCGKAYSHIGQECGCELHAEDADFSDEEGEQEGELDREWPQAETMAECQHVFDHVDDEERCHGCLMPTRELRQCQRCRAVLCPTCS